MASYRDVRVCTFTPLEFPKPEPVRSVLDAEVAEPAPIDLGPSLEEIAAEARAEGYAQGYREGMDQINAMHMRSARRLVHMITRVLVNSDRLARSVEEEVVALGLTVAEKVIEREVRTDPVIVLNVVRGALKEMHRAPVVSVRVHPDDFALLSTHWEEVAPKALWDRAQLVPDEDIERGGCVIETRHGQADAEPHAKLAKIVEAFEALRDGEMA